MTNTFYRAFSSEQYKLSKNKEIFGILLLPAFIIFAFDLYYLYGILTEGGPSEATSNPWKMVLGKTVSLFLYMLYPILVSLFIHACCDVEYKNNNYKILFTIPVSKSKIFLSKVLFMLMTVWFSMIMTYLVFLLSGYLLSLTFPELGFQNYDFREVIFYAFLKFGITLSAITMIQLSLSLTFKNFIYPIGFSMFMLVFSGLANEKKFSDFIVYTGGSKLFRNLMFENISFERLDYCNIAAVFIFAGVSFYLFVRKKGV
ncbi:ABC transporter permease [Chryseobacterium sp. OSA05B]|uniref:ABC transporter permease n=1 Tax=Chryseobacterium sp. OSA05B TaxID=2862650 RepID=UPI001CBDCE63|nr:ABC transporter permease [Chryseobacterium sp. OSA05B]